MLVYTIHADVSILNALNATKSTLKSFIDRHEIVNVFKEFSN